MKSTHYLRQPPNETAVKRSLEERKNGREITPLQLLMPKSKEFFFVVVLICFERNLKPSETESDILNYSKLPFHERAPTVRRK